MAKQGEPSSDQFVSIQKKYLVRTEREKRK
jgi:hypothetical protein